LGVCLASQHIRQRINDGRIITSLDEARIQPSSLDTVIGDSVFILDTETEGIFRPKASESVYRTFLQLPGMTSRSRRRRRRIDISDGYELKRGVSYLIKLKDRIRLAPGEYVRSSPKSSLGRLFLNTRLLADYNPSFDQVLSHCRPNTDLDLWLLVQPLVFNVIIKPGTTLNQLRFFTGPGALLSHQETTDEIEKNPIIYNRGADDVLSPAENRVTDEGLQICLDLSGSNTNGVVALRARLNPEPIDLSKKEEYDAQNFFDPILARRDGKMTLAQGEYYLIASKGILQIPPHLNVGLRDHSSGGFRGPLHFAGFVDNSFLGDLVFEVRMDEIASMCLDDGMPVSSLDLFRTGVPDKLYGKEIGSHYHGQVGPRPAKYFVPFDYAFAAREYDKLDRKVLVQDTMLLNDIRKSEYGFEFLTARERTRLLEYVKQGFFLSRYDCENDEDVLQVLPYILLFGPDDTVFAYERAKDIRKYGEPELFGKCSIGVGGHILASDGPDFISGNIRRELAEEVDISGNASDVAFLGTIKASDRPVDRVHFAMVHAMCTDGAVVPKESSIDSSRMIRIDDLMNDPEYKKDYETWSRILIPLLPAFYTMMQKWVKDGSIFSRVA